MAWQIAALRVLGRYSPAAASIIWRGVSKGLSGRVIHEQLREAGVRMSRTRTLAPIMREMSQAIATGRSISRMAGATRPADLSLPHNIRTQGKRYSYTVRLFGRDPNGRFANRWVTVTSNRHDLTLDEIREAAQDMGESGEYGGFESFRGIVESGWEDPSLAI